MSESDHVVKEYMIRKSVQDVTRLMEYSGTPWCVWRGEQGGEILAAGAGFDTLVPTPLTSTTLITDLWDAESVVEYWEAFTSLCTGEMKTEVEVKKGTCVSRARVEGDGIRGRCVFVKEDGGEVPCAFWMSVRRDAWGGVGVVVGQFLPIGRW
ncbi:hypothetical protein BC829DRAFT_390902 [Chytridium lagenaria]|nr:hypothetical protein BC829DRAFT_390902 [Chytridium lagenaria]